MSKGTNKRRVYKLRRKTKTERDRDQKNESLTVLSNPSNKIFKKSTLLGSSFTLPNSPPKFNKTV